MTPHRSAAPGLAITTQLRADGLKDPLGFAGSDVNRYAYVLHAP